MCKSCPPKCAVATSCKETPDHYSTVSEPFSAGNEAKARIYIEGDGICYFQTVSKAAFETEDRHLAIRLQIINFMAEYNKSVFKMLNKDCEVHISNERQKGAWATQAEIHATATLFQIDVRVFTWIKSGRQIHTNRGLI